METERFRAYEYDFNPNFIRPNIRVKSKITDEIFRETPKESHKQHEIKIEIKPEPEQEETIEYIPEHGQDINSIIFPIVLVGVSLLGMYLYSLISIYALIIIFCISIYTIIYDKKHNMKPLVFFIICLFSISCNKDRCYQCEVLNKHLLSLPFCGDDAYINDNIIYFTKLNHPEEVRCWEIQ